MNKIGITLRILLNGYGSFHRIYFIQVLVEMKLNKEKELIRKYKSTNTDFGYNIQQGGLNNNNGIRRTLAQILNYINGARKRPKRVHLSEAHRRNISKSLIGNSRASGNKKNRKVVLQYSLDGKFLARYNHAGEAAEILGCDSSGINRACKENNNINIANTKYKGKYKGFRWFYA